MTATDCELPKVMIDQESQRLAESTKAELKSKGMNTENKDLPADLFIDRAKRRVKLGLLMFPAIIILSVFLDFSELMICLAELRLIMVTSKSL